MEISDELLMLALEDFYGSQAEEEKEALLSMFEKSEHAVFRSFLTKA
jgi:hypothetical protein